jgi:hypothetical protein
MRDNNPCILLEGGWGERGDGCVVVRLGDGGRRFFAWG